MTINHKIEGMLETTARVFSIPIIGTANCGHVTILAEENFEGFLKVSSKLMNRNNPSGLFAIKVDGYSMNGASIHGKQIDDGDFVIIDSNRM